MINYNLSDTEIFKYTIFTIFICIFFKLLNLTINSIVIFLISVFSVYILFLYNSQINYTKKKISEEKKNKLIVSNKKLFTNKKLINFLYSIQEFYFSNPQVYNDFTDGLEKFIILYNEIQSKNTNIGINFKLMEDEKNKIIKNLESLIFRIDSHKDISKKLNKGIRVLEEFLIDILNETYYLYRKDIYDNGINNRTQLINLGPKPFENNNKIFYY